MDRGAWIKKFRKKAKKEDSKEKTKVQKHKSEKWHGNEEQRNISVYHMLQSCGVQDGSYPKTEVKKWNSYPWPQKSYLDFEIMVPIIPKLDYHQLLKCIHLPFGKSRHLEEFNMLVFIVKTICCSKKKFSRDLSSPDSRQLLQLQLFSQVF